jgi:hypothetical protein
MRMITGRKSFLYFFLIATALMLGACGDLRQYRPDAATTQRLQVIANQDAVKLQTAKDKDKLGQELGKNAPASHPIDAGNYAVSRIRPWLIGLTIASFVLWVVLFGLSFTSFSFLSGLIPAARWMAVLSVTALFVLPYLPIGIFLLIAAVCGLLIYELVKDKGNVTEAVSDAETILGIEKQAGAIVNPPALAGSTSAPAISSGGILSAVETDVKSGVSKLENLVSEAAKKI